MGQCTGRYNSQGKIVSQKTLIGIAAWLKERAERLADQRKIGTEEYKVRKEKYGVNHGMVEMKMGMLS